LAYGVLIPADHAGSRRQFTDPDEAGFSRFVAERVPPSNG